MVTRRHSRLLDDLIGLLTAVVLLSAIQVAMMTAVETTLAEPSWVGHKYVIREVPSGTRLTQQLRIDANGFHSITIDGDIAGRSDVGVVDAKLWELGTAETEVRRVTAQINGGDCCVIAFEPLVESAGRRYRLELQVRDLPSHVTLELPVVLKDETGQLTINGRETRADLRMSAAATDGTAWRRLSKAGTGTRRAIPVLLAALTVAIALAVAELRRMFARATS